MSRLILNGAELAQKDYVDDAINSIDLSPYATNSYVNNIANQAFDYISNVETQVGVVGEQVTHKQDIMQYNVMPAPSVQNVGQIAQYIGNSGTASVLPEGYQQVEYIQSHGEEYINTGMTANSDIKMEVTVLDPDMEDWEDHTLCGGGVAWGDRYLQIQCRQASMCSYGDEWDGVGFQGKSRTTLVQDRNEFSQDGEILYTFPEQTFSTTNNIYLFCAAQSDTPAEFSSFKVASFKVHDNDMLERDFIPCYRESDNEVGLYDIINDVFYTNEGTGAFEAGPIPQNYTQGYWYKCVNNQGVYSWENIDVQDVPEIELPPTIIINHDGGWSKSIPTSQFSKLATIANYYIKYNSIPNAYYISDAGVYAPIVEITISNSGDFKRFACKTGPSPNASDWGTYYGVTYKGFCSYMAFSFYVTNAEYEAGNIEHVYNSTNTSSISRISVDQSNSAILGLSGTNNIPLGTNNNASYTPTGNYNPATKKYVDDNIASIDLSSKQDVIQYVIIPTPDSSNVGQIIQYIGDTTGDFVQGYFYRCIEEAGSGIPVYTWEQINVQDNHEVELNKYVIDLTTDCLNDTLSDHRNLTAHDIQAIEDFFTWCHQQTGDVYLQINLINQPYPKGASLPVPNSNLVSSYGSFSELHSYQLVDYYNVCTVKIPADRLSNISTLSLGFVVGTNANGAYFGGVAKAYGVIVAVNLFYNNPYYTVSVSADAYGRVALANYGLPKDNTKAYTPTADYHPATKKYVDDMVLVGNTNTYYMGKTNLYNTKAKALDITNYATNSLLIAKNDANTTSMWIKCSFDSGTTYKYLQLGILPYTGASTITGEHFIEIRTKTSSTLQIGVNEAIFDKTNLYNHWHTFVFKSSSAETTTAGFNEKPSSDFGVGNEPLYFDVGLKYYDETKTYNVGDFCVYQSDINNEPQIYKCTTAIETAETWDSTHWTSRTYMQYLQDSIVGNTLGGSA